MRQEDTEKVITWGLMAGIAFAVLAVAQQLKGILAVLEKLAEAV